MFAPPAKTQTKSADSAAETYASKRAPRPPAQRVDRQTAHPSDRVRSPGLSWDFSKIPLFPPDRASSPQTPFIQAKLVVGKVDDPLEHEADRVADQVMRMPDPELPTAAAPQQVSRKCAGCQEEDEEKKDTLHTKLTGTSEAPSGEAPGIVHRVLGSPGQPLDPQTRAFMEPRFSRDLSQVRVHTDATAAESARVLGAHAYTVGTNIVFGQGQLAPASGSGQRLLAHELAHVIQQSDIPDLSPAGGKDKSATDSDIGVS